ncbi:MAG: response regulator, partial [Pseudomonadota bacterium]|nr:response regulator [Pseudomonadota bacterium]
VVEATSGASALDALERAGGQTALVLADVAMPGINGVDFAAIVGRTWPAIPVLLMTGYANSDLLREGDGQEVLRKPFTAGELQKKVAQMMARTRNGRADLGIAR